MNNKPFNTEDFLTSKPFVNVKPFITVKQPVETKDTIEELPYQHPLIRLSWLIACFIIARLYPALGLLCTVIAIYQFLYLLGNLPTYFETRAKAKEVKRIAKEAIKAYEKRAKQEKLLAQQRYKNTFGTPPIDNLELLWKLKFTLLGIFLLLAYGMSNARAEVSKLEQLTNNLREVRYCTVAYKENTQYPVWREYVGLCLPELTKAVTTCESYYLNQSYKELCKEYVYQVSLSTYKSTSYLSK